ncbi:MAG: DUF2339 domain-containing protein, partial [Dermatophilaceae bacterium]
MTPRTTVQQLESDFADAMQRMYVVGNGLARLRAEIDHETGGASGATAGGNLPGSPAASGPPPFHAPPAPVSWYQREGAVTRVLAIAGAVVTLAGIAMLLVIAVQQGWFGPPARVAAGAVIAMVLAAAGVHGAVRDRRAGRPVGSAPVALVATGAATAYLDVVAVTSGYGWLPPGLGLVLAGVVALAGLELARRWSSEPLAVLLVLGAAILAPVVADDAFAWPVAAFLALLAIT